MKKERMQSTQKCPTMGWKPCNVPPVLPSPLDYSSKPRCAATALTVMHTFWGMRGERTTHKAAHATHTLESMHGLRVKQEAMEGIGRQGKPQVVPPKTTGQS